jgi:glycosidase
MLLGFKVGERVQMRLNVRLAGRVVLCVCGLAATSGSALGQLDRPHQDEVIYQIMPIAWRDSNGDVQGTQPTRFGDINGIASAASLDYLQNLGVTMIYLQPIFPSAAYHGYQHGPADQINTRFGTQANVESLINAAHARGIKVILDYVGYGVSRNSVYYTSAYNNPSSQYDSWLAFTNAQNTQSTGYSFTTWNGSSVGFIHWNLATPAAANTVIGWAAKWLDPNDDGDTSDGVDGFRLDHIYANAPEGWGATIGFWQNFCTTLRAIKPGILIFGEHGDWGNYGTEVMTPTGFDGVLTKPWEFAARDAVLNETAAGLYSSTAATIAAVPSGKLVIAQTNDHDSDRIASYFGGSNAKQKVAAAVLMTQPFPPNIYYGDEIGMRGTKGNWGSDANDIPMREPFKWLAVAGAPMSNYWILNSSAYNGRFSQNNDGRSVQEQQGVSGSVLETYRTLISTRRNSIALRRGTYSAVTNGSSRVWSFVRMHTDQSVLVAINLGGSSVSTTLNLSEFGVAGGSTTPVSLIGGAAIGNITSANRGSYPVTIPAYSYIIASAGLVPGPGSDVDGRNIPADAAPANVVALQTCATNLGDNVGELNQLVVQAEESGLRIGLTGNVPLDGTGVLLLMETASGGQNVLNMSPVVSPPAALPGLTGTVLDAGFAANTGYFVNCFSGSVFVDQVALSSTGATKVYRGAGTVNSGRGTLTGGTNANGLLVAMDNTNAGGVTASSVAHAASATTGMEFVIPYADVGLPQDAASRQGRTVKVMAALVRGSGAFTNQVLPGVNFGSGELGVDPSFASVPGQQFAMFAFCAADFNGDGSVDFFDYLDFVAGFSEGVSAADFNRDGVVDFFDYLDFVAAFSTGC